MADPKIFPADIIIALAYHLTESALRRNYKQKVRRQPSLLQILQHRFRAVVHVQLLVNFVQVRAHGFHADAESCGDFLVEKSLGQIAENFLLAPGQMFHLLCRRPHLLKNLYDSARNLAGHGRAAVVQVLNRLQQLGGLRLF